MDDFLLVEPRDAWVEITFNRPQVLNALNEAALLQLHRTLGRLGDQAACRAIILTGAGERAFCAGADVAEMCALSSDEVNRFAALGQEAAFAIERCPKPVIAAVNGFALGGGCEIALACDLIFAADSAQFGLPELTLGILPGWGGTQRLPRRVGLGRAREMIYSSRRVGAEEAARIGLADRVVPRELLLQETRAVAAHLGTLSAAAVAAAKEALAAAASTSLEQGCGREAELFVRTFATEERPAAMGKFLKR
jgi:enoyl-CoA hydratase